MTYNIFDRLTFAEALYTQPFEGDTKLLKIAGKNPFHDRVFLTGFVESKDQVNFDIRFENHEGIAAPAVVGNIKYFEKPEIQTAIINYAVEVDKMTLPEAEAAYQNLTKNLTTRAQASADLDSLNHPDQSQLNSFLQKFGQDFPAILGNGYFMVTADRQPLVAQRDGDAPIKQFYWGSPAGLADQNIQQALAGELAEESFVARIKLGKVDGEQAIFVTPQTIANATNYADVKSLKKEQFNQLFKGKDENGTVKLSSQSDYVRKIIANARLNLNADADPIIVMMDAGNLPLIEKPELLPHRIRVWAGGVKTEDFSSFCCYEDQLSGAESTNTFSINKVGELSYRSNQIATLANQRTASGDEAYVYMEPEFQRKTAIGLERDSLLLASLERFQGFLTGASPQPKHPYNSVISNQTAPIVAM